MKDKLNLLVTGGLGFIGSALCRKLDLLGHRVTCLDNYHSGSDRNRHDGVKYVSGETRSVQDYFKEDEPFDFVFHLGEYARVEQSFADYEKVFELNYHSFPSILDFCKKQKAKLVYAASSTKFSVDRNGASESPYAFTKSQNVELLKAFSEWFNLRYSIVYFYNAYGDHEIANGRYATVVAKFIKLVQMGASELPVTSPGTQLRNFTHVEDIVDGIILAGFHGEGDDYGIGCDEKHSILDLVEYLGVKPLMRDPVPGNRMDGELRNQKIKALGWKPRHSLRNYIRARIGGRSDLPCIG